MLSLIFLLSIAFNLNDSLMKALVFDSVALDVCHAAKIVPVMGQIINISVIEGSKSI